MATFPHLSGRFDGIRPVNWETKRGPVRANGIRPSDRNILGMEGGGW